MSSTYNFNTSSVGGPRELDDDSGLNNNQLPTTPFNTHHLSPYTHSRTISNSASPSYNVASTPGESLSEYSAYQASEFSEVVEDEFFGVNFDERRVDSFNSNYSQELAYTSTNFRHTFQDHPAHTEDKPLSATFSTSSTYPLSPIHTNTSNTPSPANDPKQNSTISQYEIISSLHNSPYTPAKQQEPTQNTTIQLTPDLSGSSHTSAEGIGPTVMQRDNYRGEVGLPQWSSSVQQGQPIAFASSPEYTAPGINHFVQASGVDTGVPSVSVPENDEGDMRAGRGGLDPEARKALANKVEPTLKEQEESRRIEKSKAEVEEWMSQNSGSSEDQSAQPGYFPDLNSYQQPAQGHRTVPDDHADDVEPVDDAASIHENRLVEGQTYYDFTHPVISEVDKNILSQPRHWNDPPSVPYITTTSYQPGSANDAIRRYMENADAISIASRVATWGTRRKSEPSLADLEAVADGSFLKRLAISSKSKDADNHRKDSISRLELKLGMITDRLVRKKSDSSKLKRARSTQNIPEESQNPPQGRHGSQGSLAPPGRTPSFGKRQAPSINTAVAAMAGPLAAVGNAHARSGSIGGGATSPKSPVHLGAFRNVMSRHRSKSELPPKEKVGHGGLVNLWRDHGGPPVPTLTTPPALVEPKKREVSKPKPKPEPVDNDEDDDEDDGEGDEDDSKIEQESEPIVPNYEGFKAHVRRLNPDLKPQYNWLVSRIAHQQEIRYKNLLDLRVKHSQAIIGRNCSAGPHCMAVGGRATVMDARGNPRDTEPNPAGLQLVTDFSDDSNPGEGALTDETFPQGVPMPPTRNLPAEFECQLCFKAKKFQKPSDWTKHVHEDVQPFTCTYERCKESKSFKRKADWVRHENERHRHLEWWICQVEDCTHPCYRKDNFLQHLVREHKLPEPKQKTKAAIKKARHTEPAWIMLEQCHHETSNRPQEEPCKFCGKTFPTWKKLTVHLAKHMEHISLPVLKLVEAKNVDANTIISPVEQILTPITPAKTEGGSPFNMGSISPHPMQHLGPFSNPGYNQSQYLGPNNHAVYTQYSHDTNFNNNNNMYQNTGFNVPMDQPRGFTQMDPNSMGPMVPVRGYAPVDSGFTQPKIEQIQGFDPMNTDFGAPMATHNYNSHQTPGFSVPQAFSAATTVAGYPSTNMMDTSGGFGFDAMTAPNVPTFQHTPMTRGPSSSSYEHSPQNTPYYGGQ